MGLLKRLFSTHEVPDCVNTLQTDKRGMEVLKDPFLNKGIAFSDQERVDLELTGLLPTGCCTLEEQLARVYEQYCAQPSNIAKNIYLTALHDRNEVLFYKCVMSHIQEMLPIIYDPVVGTAIEQYSHDYRRPRGVYLSIDKPHLIEESFYHYGLKSEDVDLLVATDAEEILGIGDWGVGGIDIAIGKLAVYTACAGIHPNRVIPVMLDVGTNNSALLNDPLYMGYRHTRVSGEKYDEFIDAYVKVVRRLFPRAILHWEDFGPGNGRRILLKYREKFPTFNDDMQGTGAIALAAILNALKVSGKTFHEMRVVIFGAGTAGVGIADQILDAMVRSGLTEAEAKERFWLVDKQGLLTQDMQATLRDYQRPYAREIMEVKGWAISAPNGKISLEDVVKHVQPTILIGTSTAPHTFTQGIVQQICTHVERPIILALSNPTSLCEADPSDLIQWSKGKALVATGAPFPNVDYDKVTYKIAQANNALLYPGLGLGAIVAQASQITDDMLWAAAQAVASTAKLDGKGASLLPSVEDLRMVSAVVAVAVAEAALRQGVAQVEMTNIIEQVEQAMWQPIYPHIEGI